MTGWIVVSRLIGGGGRRAGSKGYWFAKRGSVVDACGSCVGLANHRRKGSQHQHQAHKYCESDCLEWHAASPVVRAQTEAQFDEVAQLMLGLMLVGESLNHCR